jgi:hypothetical protein
MRKLPLDLAWIHKINEHDYRKSFLKAFQADAWLDRRMRDVPLTDNGIFNSVLNPYVRFCVASNFEKETEEIQSLHSLNPCSLRTEDFYVFEPTPKWNRVMSAGWVREKKATYGRLIKHEIDRELTTKIIRAKHGYFPSETYESSAACPDGWWAYRTLPDGSTSIEYTSKLEIPHEPRPVLPTSFVLRQ